MVGMEGSQIPQLFYDYFESLSEDDKKDAARIIVAGALGNDKELEEYLTTLAYLMLGLCLTGNGRYFGPWRASIEIEYTNPANLKAWASSEEQSNPNTPGEFKLSWAYAMWLRKTLAMLHSTEIAEADRELQRDAKSSRLRASVRELLSK